jgi:hypothetical protein
MLCGQAALSLPLPSGFGKYFEVAGSKHQIIWGTKQSSALRLWCHRSSKSGIAPALCSQDKFSSCIHVFLTQKYLPRGLPAIPLL